MSLASSLKPWWLKSTTFFSWFKLFGFKHLKKGYISILHELVCNYNMKIKDLERLNLYKFVKDKNNDKKIKTMFLS